MKNYKVIAICLTLVLGLAAAVFAVNNFATRTVAAKTKMSCCADAACCAGGTCKMNGACCSMQNQKAGENQKANQLKASGVLIENASDETSDAAACDKNNAQTASGKADCCANGGSACCKTGAACCDTKKQTARL